MANKTISMSKLRLILKLHCQGEGKKSIVRTIGVSRNTVRTYIEKFALLRTTWEELHSLSDKDLDDLFRDEEPLEAPERITRLLSYFDETEKQLRRKGVTLMQLYEKYREKDPEGLSRAAFYRHFRNWKRRVYPEMHMEHKAGDKVFVDYAGDKLYWTDPLTEEQKKAEVFVAVLGASQFTYVEASNSQALEELIPSCENALHYFHGSPMAIVTDNLRSAVTKSSKYEPLVNENFEVFADHYGMAVLPTRSYKPKDKALVENAVRLVYQRIYSKLSSRKFTSLPELNEAIWELLEEYNNIRFSARPYSRRQQFEEMERFALQPLPRKHFEMRKQLLATVMKNGHVIFTPDKHYYSVPFALIGSKVKVLFSSKRVDIYYKLGHVASHERGKNPFGYTTQKEHMASHHRYVTEWSDALFLGRAKAIHPDVEYYIGEILKKKKHPEQAYKACNGILLFVKTVGKGRLISACQRAHGYGLYNYAIIKSIVQRNLDTDIEIAKPELMPVHDNIRGSEYYQ